MKLLSTSQDIIIEQLTQRISDLEFQVKTYQNKKQLLENELKYYENMSKDKLQFNSSIYYLKIN